MSNLDIIDEINLVTYLKNRLQVAEICGGEEVSISTASLRKIVENFGPEKDTSDDFDARMKKFLEGAQAIIDRSVEIMVSHRQAKDGEENADDIRAAYGKTLDTMNGRRYIRVVATVSWGNGRSVHCFVDKKTGNVLKSASWKTPAKGARGNIYNEDFGLGRMNAYGTEYNR